ncbi:efflux RND transporter permease subunit [Sulfurimonas sp. CVO]|uniref:efflux RND transporter permease subunit n=1 Tax=Sulfurimonas sp. CVO TaxID=2283483 RepID=UPI00132EB6FE|nr:efflux RND transporter permease subunit [Sulfurimonas sp. CVO]QHG90559.1 efflux RND transporter permease subunit [Sulfurimonas sp. CVO]
MFEKTIKFFIENYKINYALFFFLFIIGIFAYTKIPKEVQPTIEPSTIQISGSYSGASVDILNKMAVTPLENKIKNIIGITDIITTIRPGRFRIVLELDKKEDKNTIKENVQEAIDSIASDLPSDMDMPSTHVSSHARSLMYVSVLSSKLPKHEIIKVAKDLKEKLLKVQYVEDIIVYGESDLYYEILFDEKKIEAYGLDKEQVLSVLPELSYTFPVGKMEGKNNQFYLSTSNGKKDITNLEATLLKIGEKLISFKDIATIKTRYADSSTMASMNGHSAITLSISQFSSGDALVLSQEIRKRLKELKTEDVSYDVKMDYSLMVRESLNIVFSNILFGILLIALFSIILINSRMALVIVLGIPTSFVLGAIYFYFTGYSINVQSLIGVLLAIGIIVDDAIVISENIQQYIEKGYSPKEAAYLGTKEMAKPVFWASVTTLFSFIPLLMISGRMGEIIQLIPIAFSALILASLIESFVFLPIHCSHILKNSTKTLSWDRSRNIYQQILKIFMKYQKSFLLLFVIVVPLLIFISAKNSKFHMFQKFDSTSVKLTIAGGENLRLEETSIIIKQIEQELLKHKEKFFIDYISSTAGARTTAIGESEVNPNVGNLNIELNKKMPENFFEKYITPILSPYYEEDGRIRTLSSKEIAKILREWIKKQEYKDRFNLEEILIVEKRMGATKADIKIGIVSDDYQKAIQSVNQLQKEVEAIKGVKFSGNNIKFGIDELKFHINSYGESLGITEKYLGNFLSNVYMDKTIGTIYGKTESYEVKSKSFYCDDYEYFKNIQIPLQNGTIVAIEDICTIETIQSLEQLVKDNGTTTFYMFANVDNDIITSSEVLQKIKPTIEQMKKDGIKFIFKGEQKQKETLEVEMVLSIALALSLIFLALLYLFNSMRETLLVMSVIPFSMLGLYAGHFLLGLQITVPSLVGAIGLAGVIVNDGIIMMDAIKKSTSIEEFYKNATKRFRPIILTSITTIVGLFTLIFFATGIAVSFQPIAVTIGFGLLWGTILNLLYLPVMYGYFNKNKLYMATSR